MHPVMSELGLSVAEHEGWTRREAARRKRLAGEAAARGGGRSLPTRFVHAVRQFLDPRGYALAEMRSREIASVPVPTPPPVIVPVTQLHAWEGTVGAREPLKAA